MPFSLCCAAFFFREQLIESIDIAAIRLAGQQISSSRFHSAGALVAHLGAMQAQDHASALWAIGLRVPGTNQATVRAAIADKSVVRSWLLRGTLHIASGADLRWMLALLGERNIAGAAGRHRQLGLDDQVFAASRKHLIKALQGGHTLTRNALFALLQEQGIATAGQRGLHILWRLAQEGLLCFSDHIGKQPAFALLDEWLPAAGASMQREHALAELAARYIRSHGPATVADFAWWSGLTLSEARRGIAAASGLVARRQGEADYWMAEGALDAAADRSGVYLLPGFDEYLLGYKDRSAVLPAAHAPRIVPGGNGVFKAMLLIDGQIAGTWRREDGDIVPEAFAPLKRAHQKGLAAAAKRYLQFCGEQP